MKLNLLIALAAGVGALVAPQPQLKKVQSLAFVPALARSFASITRRASTTWSIPTQAMLSIPPHIKCFREEVGSREHLMKLSFRDFAAGAHICYTDAVFTADCYALYLSRKFDRELSA